MQHFNRNLIAAAALALLAGCASTGDTTGEDQTGVQQDATTEQQGITAQPGQDAYSYPYGQAPSQYDTYDTTTGAQAGGGQAGQAVAGGEQAGQAVAGGGAAPLRRIASSISRMTAPKSRPKAKQSLRRTLAP